MTVSLATSRNSASKQTPKDNPPYIYVDPVNPWVRPSDWLTLPAVTAGEQKIVGLYAIYPNNPNFVAFAMTTNTTQQYTVDWGDGTSQNILSGSTASHTYNYNDISASTDCSRGYRQVIITITPTVSGSTLSTVNFNIKYPNTPALQNNVKTNWLDMTMSIPNATILTIAGNAPVVNHAMLEQLTLKSVANNVTNYLFMNLYNLRKIAEFGIFSFGGLTQTFANCYNLTHAPDLPYVASTISMFGAFSNCYKLVYVPNYTFKVGGGNGFTNAFSNCYSLEVAPDLDLTAINTSNIGSFNNCVSLISVPRLRLPTTSDYTLSSMFSGCYALPTIPWTDTSRCTAMDSMFANCRNLEYIPELDTSKVTTMASMFSNCSALKKVPAFNTPALTTTFSMFQQCYALTTPPKFNGNVLANMSSTFQNCWSLTSLETFNTSNVTNMDSAFRFMTSLVSIPEFDTSKVTTMNSTFDGCSGLLSVPAFNTSNVTNMTSLFQNADSLETIPLLDTSKVTTFTAMFNGCSGLQEIPAINTSNATNTQNMFAGCTNLQSIPTLDTSKVTNCGTMFNGCSSLESIPALNLANVTVLPGNFAVNNYGLATSGVINIRVGHSYSTCMLSKTALENIFSNLGSNTTTQTITITNNYGADTAVAKTGNVQPNSNTIAIANTVGITSGMYVYATGINTGIPVTFTDAGDTVHYTNASATNVLQDGDEVFFTTITSTTGITANTRYYVVNSGTSSAGKFQLSTTPSGTALTLTTNGTGVMTIGGTRTDLNQVVTVNANSNVVINGYGGLANTAASLSFRLLNVNPAIGRNWTVTG